MKFETRVNSVSKESTTRDVVLYARDKALLVLSAQRKRLAQPPDPLRLIEGTIATLQAMRARP